MSQFDDFEIVIVGSGAAGGMAALQLAKAGLRTLVLEAGRDYDPITEAAMFRTPESAPLRASSTIDKPSGFFDATVDGGWTIRGEPYSVAPGSEPFQWWRSRMFGGRTNHWGRVALRFGPYDFKPKTRDGLGFDWPVSYDDIAPWYDFVEKLIGVTGAPGGLENTPDSPLGTLLPPPAPRLHERLLEAAFKRLHMPVAAIHAAVLTQPLNGRAPCLYATQCTRGCASRSNFQSSTVLFPEAAATGNLQIGCNSIAYEIETAPDGRATAVNFINRLDGSRHQVRARAVVLAAGAFSSTRLLLSSRSSHRPNGIGNTNGQVGRNIMDSLEWTMQAQIPALEDFPPQNDDGIFTPHIYVPWWLYKEQLAGTLDFPRGYHIEPRGGRRLPTMGIGSYIDADDPTFGADLHDKVHRRYGSYLFLTGEGEMIPNDDCYCEIDDTVTDKWGIPTLRFHWKWGDAEIRQGLHMQKTFRDVFSLLAGKVLNDGPMQMPAGGSSIHEVGGAKMGASDTDSVVDQYGRCWDTPNVFVLDGAAFASHPDKNPTLTILALAARGSSKLIELAKSGSL